MKRLLLTAIACLLLITPVCGQLPLVWNAADYGAEPGKDISLVVQQGLNTQPEHGLPVYIPAGNYYLDRPISLPRVDGAALRGVGSNSAPTTHRGAFRGMATRLIYRGPADQPAITLTGAKASLSGFTLYGRLPGKKKGSDRPSVGVQLTKPSRGLGAGAGEHENIMVCGFEVGVQIGQTPEEHNCDSTVWRRFAFSDCGAAVRVINSQGMGHYFPGLIVYGGVPVTFDIWGGGDVHASDALLFATTLFRFGGDNPPHLRPGANNGTFTATNIKVDAQHGGRFVLMDGVEPSAAHLIAERVRVSGPSDFVLARLAEGHRLTVRDLDGPAEFSIEQRGKQRAGGPTGVVLENIGMRQKR